MAIKGFFCQWYYNSPSISSTLGLGIGMIFINYVFSFLSTYLYFSNENIFLSQTDISFTSTR